MIYVHHCLLYRPTEWSNFTTVFFIVLQSNFTNLLYRSTRWRNLTTVFFSFLIGLQSNFVFNRPIEWLIFTTLYYIGLQSDVIWPLSFIGADCSMCDISMLPAGFPWRSTWRAGSYSLARREPRRMCWCCRGWVLWAVGTVETQSIRNIVKRPQLFCSHLALM